jgi:tripartite-type tricarboxylate transporter receptor subunit TctC
MHNVIRAGYRTALAPGFAADAGAQAAGYPGKSIRLIVPFAEGGAPKQFAATIKSDIAKYAKITMQAGIKAKL